MKKKKKGFLEDIEYVGVGMERQYFILASGKSSDSVLDNKRYLSRLEHIGAGKEGKPNMSLTN